MVYWRFCYKAEYGMLYSQPLSLENFDQLASPVAHLPYDEKKINF